MLNTSNCSRLVLVWRDGVVDPLEGRGVDFEFRSKREFVAGFLRTFESQRPLAPAERLRIDVALGEILADLGGIASRRKRM